MDCIECECDVDKCHGCGKGLPEWYYCVGPNNDSVHVCASNCYFEYARKHDILARIEKTKSR